MTRCMPGSGDGDDSSVVAQPPALGKRAERAVIEREGFGCEAGRKWLTQQAAERARHRSPQEAQLSVVDEHPPTRVYQPVDMVAMCVGEHDLGDVVHGQPCR